MCIQIIERFSVCRCIYYRHAVDPCPARAQRHHRLADTIPCVRWSRKLLILTFSACKRKLSSLATHVKDMHVPEEHARTRGTFGISTKTQSAHSGSGNVMVSALGSDHDSNGSQYSRKLIGSPLLRSSDMWSWIGDVPARRCFHVGWFTKSS
jgi:hypothetical protein